MHTTSQSLLNCLRGSGDPTAWDRFVALYSGGIYSWARSLGLQHADAADLVQDVFAILVQKLPDFEYDPARSFRGWLWTITRNRTNELARSRRPVAVPAEDLSRMPDDASTTGELTEDEFRRHLVGRVVNILEADFPPEVWRAFWEHVVNGKPAARVAAELGMNIWAVYTAKIRVSAHLHKDSPTLSANKHHPELVCPSAEGLRDILLGRGPEDAPDRLARHLPVCRRCSAAVDELNVNTLVVDVLRGGPLPSRPTDHEIADVASRLSGLFSGSRDFDAPNPAPEPMTEEIASRTMLGPYRLIEPLGTGGMGMVYRAEDTNLQRFVALKVLRPGVEQDPRYRDRFLREARAMAAVRNDHIVTVFQVGEAVVEEDRSVPYLAMELLSGSSLLDWMRENTRPPIDWVLRIGRQAALGLAAAHDGGLVHRDVKPGNLWLESPPGWNTVPPDDRPPLGSVARVKLLDFGLARPLAEDSTGGVSGTPGYMAPEQARGRRLDGRADLFGLGCVLYELCTGRHPFPGKPGGWANDSSTAPPAVDELNPDIPAGLANLIARMLARAPADRPASARTVANELAKLDTHRAPETVLGHATVTVFDTPTPVRRPRLRARILGVVALGMVGMTAGAGLYFRDRSPPPDTSVNIVPTENGTTPTSPDLDGPWPSDRPPFPGGPPDELWRKRLSDMPPNVQFRIVNQKLEELNPGYKAGNAFGWIEPELVIRLSVTSNAVHDLRPLAGFPDLKTVGIKGESPNGGTLTDLTPLADLRLHKLTVSNQPKLRDLGPLRDCRLVILDISNTAVALLTPLSGQPITTLTISHTRVTDLSPVRELPMLQTLQCEGCRLESLEPLVVTGIKNLSIDIRSEQDRVVLRRMTKLEQVNGKPVEEALSEEKSAPR